MYVIINADDFGLHPAVTRAVIELSKRGIITSTSVLANGRYAEDIKKIPNLGIGVHLNILRGKPISQPDKIKSLTGDDDLFLLDYKKLFIKYLSKRINLNEVYHEWSKQIEKIKDLGVSPTHLDSVKHIHAWPGLMEIALKLADKYKIKWVRKPVENNSFFRFDAGGLKVKILNFFSLLYKKDTGINYPYSVYGFSLFFQKNFCLIRNPDLVWGISDQNKDIQPEKFNKYLIKNKDKKVIEFICHPGLEFGNDPDIPEEFGKLKVKDQWKNEYEILSDPIWKEIIKTNGGELVSYNV